MMTKDQFDKSLVADFSAAVEATYQDLIKAAVAAEQEECAKICDELQQQWRVAGDCADAIRTRKDNMDTKDPAFINCDEYGIAITKPVTSKTGGPAFPAQVKFFAEPTTGMTLRDYFAAKVIVSLATYEEYPPERAAKYAYEYADAMLKAREV